MFYSDDGAGWILKPAYIEFGVVCIYSAIVVCIHSAIRQLNPAGQLLLIAINSGLIDEWMTSAYYLNSI